MAVSVDGSDRALKPEPCAARFGLPCLRGQFRVIASMLRRTGDFLVTERVAEPPGVPFSVRLAELRRGSR